MTVTARLPDGTPRGDRRALAAPQSYVTDPGPRPLDDKIRDLCIGGMYGLSAGSLAGAQVAFEHGPAAGAAVGVPLLFWAALIRPVRRRVHARRIRRGTAVPLAGNAPALADKVRESALALARTARDAGRPDIEARAADAYRRVLLAAADWGTAHQRAFRVRADALALPQDDPARPAAHALADELETAAQALYAPVAQTQESLSETLRELDALVRAQQARDRLALERPHAALPPPAAGPDPLAGQAEALRHARSELGV